VSSSSPFRIMKTILIAGLVGAFLIDFYLVVTMTWIFHTATPRALFLWDASNLLGPPAFQRGFGTELFGCFLHLIVSMLWAAFFVLVPARIRANRPAPSYLGNYRRRWRQVLHAVRNHPIWSCCRSALQLGLAYKQPRGSHVLLRRARAAHCLPRVHNTALTRLLHCRLRRG
jgi:hypothetical protein